MRVLFLLLSIAGAVYLGAYFWERSPEDLPIMGNPQPLPTPTRSAVSYAAEATDLYWQGQLTEAIAAYQQALNLEPDQPDLYVELARLLIFRGRPERGVEMAEEALRLDPENARAWAVLCLAYDWMGLPDEALSVCQEAISLDPTLADAYAYRAEAYIDLGNWFSANDDIDKALRLDENSVDVQRTYGYVMEVQGNYTAAIAAYRRALEQHDALVHLYLSIGRNQQVLGRPDRAQDAYVEAVEKDPGSVAARDMLAWSYLLQGNYDEAQVHLDQALELDPTYSRALGRLGTVYFQRRNYEDAIPTFERAIRYGEAESRRGVAFFRLTLEERGEIGGAPAGREVAVGTFSHPRDPLLPLRATVKGGEGFESVKGYVRLEVMDGRYVVRLEGLPETPLGQAYVGWFEPLTAVEGGGLHTGALVRDGEGQVNLRDTTGPVDGPPIEYYYTISLSYYFLDRCPEARPYIQAALSIDPQDANALETQRLCGGP